MRNNTVVRLIVLLFALLVLLPMGASMRKKRVLAKPDTIPLAEKLQDFSRSNRMSCSTFPVKIHTSGRAVQIQSDHNQILPIYTRGGAFYMAVRLNKGVNWLNGLPRGNYFINNRPITIN